MAGFLERSDSTTAEALKNSFLAFDQQLLAKSRAENWHDGTTALVALLAMTPALGGAESQIPITRPTAFAKKRVYGNKRASSESTSSVDSDSGATSVDDVLLSEDGLQNLTVYLANAGDCRAISAYGDGRVFQLSTDHTPLLPYERWRIFKAGGNVKLGRIEGKLSVSRGFGDRQFKEPRGLVSALPEVISCVVTQNLRFIVLACDGVWGWLNNAQVAQFVGNALREGQKPDAVVKDLVKYAFDQGSSDNISVVLLYFTLQNNTNHTKVASLSASHASSLHNASSGPSATASMSSDSPRGRNTPTISSNVSDLNLSKSVPNKHRGSSKKNASPRALALSADDIYTLPILTRNSLDSSSRVGAPLAHAKSEELTTHNGHGRTPLSSSYKARKFNFSGAAAQMKWSTSYDVVDRRADRALVIKTHVPTGEYSLLDLAEGDSTTSEVEALILDSRPSVEAPRSSSRRSHPQSHPRDVENSSSISTVSNDEKSDQGSERSQTHDSEDSSSSLAALEPKRTSSVRIPVPTHKRQVSGDSNGPRSTKARHASVPDDDDAVAYSGAAKSMSPVHQGLTRPPARSPSKPLSRKPNYGESDSESDQEAMLRRRSFDDTPTTRTTPSNGGTRSKPPSRAGSSAANKANVPSKKAAKDPHGSPKEDADSNPDTPDIKRTPSKKKRYEPVFDDQLNEEEVVVHRRAASFDSHREEKKKKSRK